MVVGAHIGAEKLIVAPNVQIYVNMGVSNTLGCNVLCLNMVISWLAAGCMSQPGNMNYGITCLSNGWNYVITCFNGVLT